ncbi:MAG: MASE3 domain-containing protein [Methanolinea sp.]|nr:MASE3 domain-containing protein [Methanolinea sp.]
MYPISKDIICSHRDTLLNSAGIFAVLLVLAIISTYNYLVFHSIIEIFTIIVSFSIFFLIWNSRKYIDNGFFIILGAGFLFSGGIDIVHTLAYKGMGVFPFGGADLPTQLWIAARYLQAFSLLLAPFAIGRKVRMFPLLIAFGTAFALLLWSIFAGFFPHCFIEGQGLTPFKVYSEYVISGILILSILLLIRAREAFDASVLSYLVLANVFTIAAEFSFTAYVSVYGFANMLGHLLRLVAVFLWYRAFLVVGIERPYDLLWRELVRERDRARESEENFQSLFDHMLEGFAYCRMINDEAGRPTDWEYLKVNPSFEKLTGLSGVVGKRVTEVIPDISEKNPELFEIYGRVAATGQPAEIEIFFKPLAIWLHISVFSPKKDHFVAVFENISRRKNAEIALRESEAKFRHLAENAKDLIYRYELIPVRRFSYVSPSATSITGYTPEDHYRDPDLGLKIVHEDDRPLLGSIFTDRDVFSRPLTLRWRRKDGQVIWTEQHNRPVYDEGGRLIAIEGIARDVTEKKLMESEILSLNRNLEQRVAERTEELRKANVLLQEEVAQRKKAEEDLKRTLDERTVILRELYHRVKNNMQIIISMMNLQLRKIGDPAVRHLMEETQNRVRAMALVHEMLYKSENLSEINLAQYIPLLVNQIFSSTDTRSQRIAKSIEVGDIMVTIDKAIPLGLIINELVTNSLTHAFPEGRQGSIGIRVRKKDHAIAIRVSDDGTGIPEDFNWKEPPTLGLRIVLSLVGQLRGTIDLDRRQGTVFSIEMGIEDE